jgi:hypothetical protein
MRLLAPACAAVHDGDVQRLTITWRLRVLAALLLATLLRMSDGSELWARTIPDVLTVAAVTAAVAMLLAERRASRAA